MGTARFNRVDIAEAAVAYGDLYHSGQWSWTYRDMCRGQNLLRAMGLPDYVTPDALSENGRAIYLEELGGKESDFDDGEEDDDGGYQYCACRDCFNEVVGHGLCPECDESECDESGQSECDAPCAYGGAA